MDSTLWNVVVAVAQRFCRACWIPDRSNAVTRGSPLGAFTTPSIPPPLPGSAGLPTSGEEVHDVAPKPTTAAVTMASAARMCRRMPRIPLSPVGLCSYREGRGDPSTLRDIEVTIRDRECSGLPALERAVAKRVSRPLPAAASARGAQPHRRDGG